MVGAISGITLGILAGPLVGGLIVLVRKLMRGEKAEFNEVFAHFDKFVPALLVVLIVGVAYFVFGIITGIIGSIWIIGGLIALVLNLAVYPVLALLLVLSLCFVMDKGLEPVAAIKRAFGCLMTNPAMVWLYALIMGIVAGLGAIAILMVPIGALLAVIGIAGLGLGFLLFAPFSIACVSLTAPMGVIGFTAAYEELSVKEPGTLKLGKQTLQIAGIVLAALLVVGLVARFAFHRYSYPTFGFFGQSFLRGREIDAGRNTGSFTIKGKNGARLSIGAGLPSDFPKDVPIYPRAEVQGTLGSSSSEGGGSMTTMSTKDSADTVYGFYKDKLGAAGWTVEQTILGISFKKDDRMVTVLANENDGETTILLTVGKAD
ncbi:MAG: hypothetical protein ACM3ZC_11980 [Bacteroidota bacterium]